ncbi:hypothetical protein OUZ56_018426 [Daphnia magna]|uniref:Uncharacterized protein n=1 Tax=Daphnia magna TaxID=35525 RepID=A0ABQ9Z9F0_9CRUS|nr:hypothetical protein OUZ56_018426 [Daphnia magna]
MVPRRGKRITAGKPAKNLTFSESYLGQRSVKSKVKKVREIGMCPPKTLARVAVGKPKKPAVECFNSSINSPPVISSNSLREQLSANNRNLNNFHVSPDSSPKKTSTIIMSPQTTHLRFYVNILNSKIVPTMETSTIVNHVSPDSSPKNLRQHSQEQNRFNNRDLNNYHISLGSSPISSSQNSQQQTSFVPISSTPVHKRNLIKETQSDSNSLSVSRISHHKGHDAEPSASNIKLPNEIVDYLTKSMVRQDELFRVVQSLVASRPITTSEEEHDDFVEKLPDFPISSMEDFLSLERGLLQKRFKIYFVSLFPFF